MAAKVLEGANQVWERVNIALQGASPEVQGLFKALKLWLATQKGNPRLQYLPFTDVTVDQATALTAGGGTLYAIYAKKGNTATDAYFKVNDSATLAGGAAGINFTNVFPLLNAREEVAAFFQPGQAIATGLTVASETTGVGGTDSTAGDGPSGFMIVG